MHQVDYRQKTEETEIWAFSGMTKHFPFTRFLQNKCREIRRNGNPKHIHYW